MNSFGPLLFICIALRVVPAAESADAKCPGPLAFYESIECKSIECTIVNGCAYQYDCDKVKSLPWDKCFVKTSGHAYENGDSLKDEDASPCDIGCVCSANMENVSEFKCSLVDCFLPPPKPGCYRKNSALNCCPGEEVCPESPEDRAECTVGDRTYRDGEYFGVESEPDLMCVCQPGYEGNNVKPFCVKTSCSPLFQNRSTIAFNCAPVYDNDGSPQTSCSVRDRCQNEQDVVIKSTQAKDEQKAGVACQFGNLTMEYGDELNQATDYSSVCVKCVCEVGPTPTCQRIPDEECDVTAHPPFAQR